jgi:putative addiction module CopG family antidote
MIPGMDHVTLTPELDRFAAEAIATGRYRDVSEVVRAGLSLLK